MIYFGDLFLIHANVLVLDCTLEKKMKKKNPFLILVLIFKRLILGLPVNFFIFFSNSIFSYLKNLRFSKSRCILDQPHLSSLAEGVCPGSGQLPLEKAEMVRLTDPLSL